MSQFAVYDRAGELQAVKLGFSWPALFFSGIWAFVKEMHGLGVALLGALVLPVVLGETGQIGEIGHALGHFAPLVVGLTAGGLGNSWWRERLERSGFEQLGTIDAGSPEEAIGAWQDEDRLPPEAPRDSLSARAKAPQADRK